MAADVEEGQNDEVQTAGAVSGDGASNVVVEADQVSSVDVEADETPVVEKSEDSGVVENKTDDESDDDDEDDEDYLVEEGEIAGDYLEQLLDVLDFDGDIDLDVEGDRAIVSIDGGDDLAKLVGRKGEVLDALQE
ncbi:MAG: single-stranded DNA-binding protein, partial [Rhodococcus sp. (in: high G+C Gram-positive bacteria)]